MIKGGGGAKKKWGGLYFIYFYRKLGKTSENLIKGGEGPNEVQGVKFSESF